MFTIAETRLIYHAQRMEVKLAATLQRDLPRIAHLDASATSVGSAANTAR